MSLLNGLAVAFSLTFAAFGSRQLVLTQPRSKDANMLRRDAAAVGIAGAVDLNSVDPVSYGAVAERHSRSDMSGVKRFLDIVLSLITLTVFVPVMAAIVLAIKLETPGPVVYRQVRVGFGGKLFNVLKFRSMTIDAEKNGPQYASVNDERITRVGRILRKFRLDEIPQAVNVLRGEMSFVGPRPERPEFVETLEREIPNYHCRHMIKPGITGWAQVKYEYAASVEGARNKLRYDLYYIRNFSLLLDLIILLKTVRVALFGLGSR